MVTVATLFLVSPSAARIPPESTEILRAQIELSVCDQRGAGTTSAVFTTLGNGVRTWLEQPGGNFDRGRRYGYDLLLDQLQTLGDVSALTITVDGTDDLCLRDLKLIINGSTIFLRSSTAGIWLNATTHYTLTESAAELRINTAWQHFGWSLAEWIATTGAAVPREELRSRLQSTIASVIHDLALTWRPSEGARGPIRLTRRGDGVVSVSADLTRRVNYWFDNDAVLDFDLRLCGTDGSRVDPLITNVSLHQTRTWYVQVLDRGDSEVEAQILATLRARLSRARPLVIAGGVCPHVDQSANLTF